MVCCYTAIVWPFPDWHIVGLIQCVAFSNGLISLKFPPCFLCDLTSDFFLLLDYMSAVWMSHSVCIRSPIGGHLGCVQVLAVMSKAAINIHVQVFV